MVWLFRKFSISETTETSELNVGGCLNIFQNRAHKLVEF